MSRADIISNNVVNMMMFYYNALVEEGCQDPKREMATNLSKMINLSQAQAQYVLKTLDETDINVLQILNNISIILTTTNTKYEDDNINVAINSINNLVNLLGGVSHDNKQGEKQKT